MRKNSKTWKTARLIALSFFALLPLVPANAAQVAVTVEKLTADGGFIVEPELVELPSVGTTAAEVLIDLLLSKKINNFSYNGSPTGSNFFLERIDNLGVFEASGWMITVNNYFIGKSAGLQKMNNGDVMRWQYTKQLGADIGGNSNKEGFSTKADKDKLIWKVAEINAAEKQSSYSTYNAAVSVLKKLNATQAETNSALAALNSDTSGGGNNNDGGSNNSGSDNNNSSGSSNNSGSDNNNNGGSNTGTDNNNSGGSNTGTDNSNS
ncbi:MAG: DUF4430 domain-containing protein, partial [Synergistaceae bacterium]|nr:DUF4430 domain-containing protein [Synergistaceae bacterium]